MTKRQHLFAIKEHLKDAIEGDRKLLAKMWELGVRSGWRFDKLNERYQRSQDKYYKVINEICPLPNSKNKLERSVASKAK